QRRGYFYGEIDEGAMATRMIHNGRYKLIYYPAGNGCQLFDLHEDPHELQDLAASPAHMAILDELQEQLIGQLYGGDEAWVDGGRLMGIPNQTFVPGPN